MQQQVVSAASLVYNKITLTKLTISEAF